MQALREILWGVLVESHGGFDKTLKESFLVLLLAAPPQHGLDSS